ncbi:hypothetical protein QBC32DRAFT_217384, partial [Pseudoneurospora amorphoporcata]
FACGCEIPRGFVLLCGNNCSQIPPARAVKDANGQWYNNCNELCPTRYQEGWQFVLGRGFVRRLGPKL